MYCNERQNNRLSEEGTESLGGQAKDFYDLYFLSRTFMPLSKFAAKYCSLVMKEGLIRWYQSYDRMDIVDGILTVDIDKKIDYRKAERYFKTEIDKIIKSEMGEI